MAASKRESAPAVRYTVTDADSQRVVASVRQVFNLTCPTFLQRSGVSGMITMAMTGKVPRMNHRETKSVREIVKATSLTRARARKYLRIDRVDAQIAGGLSGVMFTPRSAVWRCQAPYDDACSCVKR